MKLVDKRYSRLEALDRLTSQAGVRVEQRDGRRWRRNPDSAAIIQAERLLQAQPSSVWKRAD